MNKITSYLFKKNKLRAAFLVCLMMFISTSTFPYFSELLARANIQIYELNEEENETHNQNSKSKIGNYLSNLELQKLLESISSNIFAIIFQLKQHINFYPEISTPPPEQYTLN